MIRTNRFTPYLFILPLVGLLVFIFGYPLVKVVDFSLRRVRGFDGPYVGFDNYSALFRDPVFGQSLQHNLILLLGVVPLTLISLLLAIALYERLRGWRFFRTLVFVPYILAVPIVGVVLKNSNICKIALTACRCAVLAALKRSQRWSRSCRRMKRPI